MMCSGNDCPRVQDPKLLDVQNLTRTYPSFFLEWVEENRKNSV